MYILNVYKQFVFQSKWGLVLTTQNIKHLKKKALYCEESKTWKVPRSQIDFKILWK